MKQSNVNPQLQRSYQMSKAVLSHQILFPAFRQCYNFVSNVVTLAILGFYSYFDPD